jgi:hypothetical protein
MKSILYFVARGEQPDEAIYSLPGELRGDVPLSKSGAKKP